MKKLYTQKTVDFLSKSKDVNGIIRLYELEKKMNPPIQTIEEIKSLTHVQKEVLKESISKGKTFGLPGEFFDEIKDFFGLNYAPDSSEQEYPF